MAVILQADLFDNKRCTRCLTVKPLSEFASRGDGQEVFWCKTCYNENRKQRRHGYRYTGLHFFAHCYHCDLWKPRSEFGRQRNGRSVGACKECTKVLKRADYKENKDARLSRMRETIRRRRMEMIAAYGGKCQCCGETHWEFLNIDHIQGGGKEHQKAIGGPSALVRHLRNLGWPKDTFRLLCWNCNCARGLRGNGICPHVARVEEAQRVIVPLSPQKRCPKCGEMKDRATEFHHTKSGKASPYCKPCTLVDGKARLQLHRDGVILLDSDTWLDVLRHCPRCNLWMVAKECFHRGSQGGYQGECKACCKERRAARIERVHEAQRERDAVTRQEVFAAYGGACVCCGENRWEFLTMDHVNGGGTAARKTDGSGAKFYAKLKKLGFPKDNFRLLCWNCNCSRGILGYCPHQLAY